MYEILGVTMIKLQNKTLKASLYSINNRPKLDTSDKLDTYQYFKQRGISNNCALNLANKLDTAKKLERFKYYFYSPQSESYKFSLDMANKPDIN